MSLNINSENSPGKFDDIIAGTDGNIQQIALSLRGMIAQIMPGVTEVTWSKQRIAGYGVGPKKMSEHFCYIAPSKSHVNLGFYYGAELSDPSRLMEGTGKLLRHVKIRSTDEINNPELKDLLIRASKYLPRLKKD